jgi:hypothetical protein
MSRTEAGCKNLGWLLFYLRMLAFQQPGRLVGEIGNLGVKRATADRARAFFFDAFALCRKMI